MTFTNTQTKLGQAITTNDSGDYAVRTIIEGDQTLENLTLTGDLNGGGGHILNDQTTTNMMSKGTVYRFDGVDDEISTSIAAGSGDFAVFAKINPDIVTGGAKTLLCGSTNSFLFYISSSKLVVAKANVAAGTASTTTLVAGVESSVGYVKSGATGTYYINGVPAGTTSDSRDYSATSNSFGAQASSAFLKGVMSAFAYLNFAPTAAEVKDLISGNIPFKWQYGSQTAQTSGTLEIGQAYIIDDWITADDFTNVGGLNVDGTIFVATGTTPTTWTNSSSLRPLGAVALYDQTSITANNWFDLANGNTGAVTGASVLNPKGIATDEDNIPNFSITSGITADTGSAQGNGVLTSSINQISVCANVGDAVTLPSAKPGKVLWVVNDGANASDVFPASGDNIDEAGANTAKSLPANGEMQFICTSAGHWSTITSA